MANLKPEEHNKQLQRWNFSQLVNILLSVSSRNTPLNNGNSLWCVNHKILEKERVKENQAWVMMEKNTIGNNIDINQILILCLTRERKKMDSTDP